MAVEGSNIHKNTDGVFRVIVAGSRDFNDYNLLSITLDRLLQNVQEKIVVVCGEARGADTLGKRYAEARGYYVDSYPADWNRYGRKAGYLRNRQMADNADALVAFWDGKSPGTKTMISLARELGLKVRIKQYNPN